MSLINLQNKKEINPKDFKDGLIAIFTCDPDSSLAQSQLTKLQENKAELEKHPITIIFVTDQEEEVESQFFYQDSQRELVNLSSKVSDQKTLGQNLIVLVKEGDKISHGDTKEEPEDSEDWVDALFQVAKNFQEKEADEDGYYKWGQVVPETAEYLCKDCGYVEEFEAGTIFPICEVCIAGEPSGPSGPGEGYWEKV